MPGVLYSFPLKIGAGRICNTAWQQVSGLALAGCDVFVSCGVCVRPFSSDVQVRETLVFYKGLRIPYKALGMRRAMALHDRRTARWLCKNAAKIDLVHLWPSGCRKTMLVAKSLGIPTFLERPNAHTAYAYEAAAQENEHLGITLPKGHDHAFNQAILDQEEEEFERADFLLCPSEFVARSFQDRGFKGEKLVRHRYGCDLEKFSIGDQRLAPEFGLTTIYVGVCEPRKGLHFALEAWTSSKASEKGKFLICGSFVPHYQECLKEWLNHPGVEYLGHRNDTAELMSTADLFVLSSVEEGSALVTYEARAAGCVLLVSDATGAVCRHDFEGLVHPMRSVDTLRNHFDLAVESPEQLKAFREASLLERVSLSWEHAGIVLKEIYESRLSSSETAIEKKGGVACD